MARDISNSDDIIDSRDVIKRIEELQAEREDLVSEAEDDTNVVRDEAREALREWDESSDGEELKVLLALQEEGEGSPDWPHGEALIRDTYFKTYAQELADDIGAVKHDAGWPAHCIDWDRAADELKMDYTAVDYGGVDYWIRS